MLAISPRNKRNPSKPESFTLAGKSIAPCSASKYLGVILDDSLPMKAHVENIRKVGYYQLRLIRNARLFLDLLLTRLLVHSLIISRIYYCNALLFGLPSTIVQRLRIQNSAARLQPPARSSSSATLLRELHWLPVKERIIFKMCLLAFKCVVGLAPDYLKKLIPPYRSAREGLSYVSEL